MRAAAARDRCVCTAVRPAKTRFTSSASRRQLGLGWPRIARCTRACADRRCQSSGTRWPLATPTIFSLWRIAASSAGPSLTASSILQRTMPAQLAAVVGDHHVLDRLALRRGVDHQQLLDRAVREHLEQLAGAGVALRHAGGVDQHHLLGRQQVEQVLERGAVVRGVHRHAEDAAVGAQLLVGADAVGIERDQAEVATRRGGRRRRRRSWRCWSSCRHRWRRSGRTRRPLPRAPARSRRPAGCARARWPPRRSRRRSPRAGRRRACWSAAGEKPQSSSFCVRRAPGGAAAFP